MDNMKNNIAANLRYLRNKNGLSQEQVAEKVGVSRQAVAKWESGDSLPDIIKCDALAELYDVSLNDLVRYNSEEGMPIPPRNKHIFGVVTIGERGQISLPKKSSGAVKFRKWNHVSCIRRYECRNTGHCFNRQSNVFTHDRSSGR